MRYMIVFLFFALPAGLHAQDALLQSFSARQQDEDVLIKWVIGQGNQCSDVEIQHSTDSVSFTVVYTYPGICGSNDEAATYTWVHTHPVPDSKNHYRLNFPASGFSDVITVHHHSYEGTGYVAAPSPSSGPVTIYFRNSQNTRHTLILFDVNGREVTRIDDIVLSEVTIERALLRPGTYFFRLFDDPSRFVAGKIILL
jgi:hypothetical protein